MTKGDKDHGGFRGESKRKYWVRSPIKKSKEAKEASPFNVFMKAELLRLKKVVLRQARLGCELLCYGNKPVRHDGQPARCHGMLILDLPPESDPKP